MESITPARTRISDRFPVASFTVRAPEKRYFEIACATDPTLFHVSQKGKRTPRNFFSSRARGLIRGSREGMTYMMPPDQLQQFAGARRLYYALATYGGPRGEDARFSIHPNALDRTPCITLSADFTGRTLDRARIGRVSTAASRYGSPATASATALRWGGDDALEAMTARQTIANPNAYDDGFDPGLWEREELAQSLDDGSDDMMAGDSSRTTTTPPTRPTPRTVTTRRWACPTATRARTARRAAGSKTRRRPRRKARTCRW